MTNQPTISTPALWARFRFSVVGALLSAPPARGELKTALESLAAKTWTHPTVSGREVRFAAKTIERWLYRARQERDDPVGGLRRAVRKDSGKVSLKPELIAGGVSPGSEAASAPQRRHDLPRWGAVRDPVPLPSLSGRGGALSAVGPRPGRSGGSA